MRPIDNLAVVVPLYNEEAGLNHLHTRLSAVLQTLDIPYELVYVDDGSHDQTYPLLDALAEEDPHVSVIALARNFGHQAALTAGLDVAAAQVVISMDGDLQHPPETIPDLLAAYQQGAEIVYAVRSNSDNVAFSKRLISGTFYRLMRRIANVSIIPDAADFRLMSAEALAGLRQMREYHRYLRGMVPWLGFPHAIVTYTQPERYAGKPAYTFRKSLRLALDGLFSFTSVPLQLITWLGLLVTGAAFAYLVYVLAVVALGYGVAGWASVIITLLILSGVQLISIGIIAQYVGMIFEQTKQRPLYIARHTRLSTMHQRLKKTNDSETNHCNVP